jgi:hypothetical protein
LIVLALKVCLDLGINLFKHNSGCCIFVNFSSVWNTPFHGKLGFVLGLVYVLKSLYGETSREIVDGKDSEICTKNRWKNVDKLISTLTGKFLVLYP